ncbi:MAG: TetR/AcrR family transcriptional regulator [Saprospiraceae bacterium]
MKNTKQNILDTAKQLFNELGYSNVTIRMIASRLGMSSGNLNYHFQKREDILEALYFEMVAVFDERVSKFAPTEITFKIIQTDIISSMGRMVDYRFFWTDLYHILKTNENIRSHFEKVKADRLNGYQLLFKVLIQQDLLNKNSFKKEYEMLGERMVDYSNTWLYASELYETTKAKNEVIHKAAFQLFSMMIPYMTTEGHLECGALYPDFFS